jgi:copper homeostasis protein (lipoprotein)
VWMDAAGAKLEVFLPMLTASRYLRCVVLAVHCFLIATAAPSDTSKPFERFTGMLPCADCPGIRLELTLYAPPSKASPGNYELKQTYEGSRHGASTYSEKGTWTTIRGSAKNPNATVYELDRAGSDSKQFYLRADKNTLRLLDFHKQELPPQIPHTLKRVNGT